MFKIPATWKSGGKQFYVWINKLIGFPIFQIISEAPQPRAAISNSIPIALPYQVPFHLWFPGVALSNILRAFK